MGSHTGEETMTKYTGARKMVLTIEENGEDISMRVQWFPDLDLKTGENNHPQVLAAASVVLKAIRDVSTVKE